MIVGGDEVSYGARPKDAAHWREKMLRELSLDPTRTHFMGRLPRADYLKVLQVSAAHVYLTYPFVLSWSLLEAMACGACVVASDTAPVRELVRDGVNGMLVPFFDPAAIAAGLEAVVAMRGSTEPLRHAARRTAQGFGWEAGVKAYGELMHAATSSSPLNGPMVRAGPLNGRPSTGVEEMRIAA